MSTIPGLIHVPVENVVSSSNGINLTGFNLETFTVPENHIFGKCRLISEFSKISHIGEGAFGTVYKVKDKISGHMFALKKMKIEKEVHSQCMPMYCTREINILKMLKHENIINLLGIAVGKNFESTALILEYCPYKLSNVIDDSDSVLGQPQVKIIMRHIFSGLECIHKHGILHRDLTVNNILFSQNGILKITDFGFARKLSDGDMTPNIVSRWYRAPEILFGSKMYTSSIDIWSAACIFAEMLIRKPLFKGDSDNDMIMHMIEYLGTPTEAIWPGFSELPLIKEFDLKVQPFNKMRSQFGKQSSGCIGLLHKLFIYNPKKRFSARQSLQHSYFEESPTECSLEVLLEILKQSESF